MKITFYLDDILICGDTARRVQSHLSKAISLLCNLGFSINYPKSSLIPSQKLFHLGYLWNTCDMTICLPLEKIDNIRKSPSSVPCIFVQSEF